jgi:tripartite-type tricarboxylate transporter receptor subunit TctC
MLNRRLLLALVAAVPLALAAGPAAPADPYPSRAVTMIVPYAAGGATDTVGRILAESMGQTLGQRMIVENVGGVSDTIGRHVSEQAEAILAEVGRAARLAMAAAMQAG